LASLNFAILILLKSNLYFPNNGNVFEDKRDMVVTILVSGCLLPSVTDGIIKFADKINQSKIPKHEPISLSNTDKNMKFANLKTNNPAIYTEIADTQNIR
jgi:hypothetical protein